MTSFATYLRIDPMVTELLKAGLTTYRKHFKEYIVLSASFIGFFAVILEIPDSMGLNMYYYGTLNEFFRTYQNYTQTLLFYLFIGLIITTITYFLTFREPLRSGELGLRIGSPWTIYNQLCLTILYNALVLLYLLTWVYLSRSFFYVITFNRYNLVPASNISYFEQIHFLVLIISLNLVLFLVVIKSSYHIYMIDETNIPLPALRSLIILLGFLFGLLVFSLDLVNFFYPSTEKIAIIITFLSPGILLLPVLGYSMAHLKVVLTALNFEYLFRSEESEYY